MNYLQPYKGKATRHTCPSCGRKHSFTLYMNGQTHELINWKVGKCNRELKCGYHYPPKQFFMDNPSLVETWHATSKKENIIRSVNHLKPIGTIPCHFLKTSLSPASNFVSFLQNHFTVDQINAAFEKYLLGATKRKEVIFWQIDTQGRIRTGKIMQYNPDTGKRIKHQSGAIDWVHNKLKKSGRLPDEFNLQQCFFGEHLLKTHPNTTVAIVESEKTAIIASCILPELVWLAAGNLNGLSIEKCHVLNKRKVILYPDQGACEKWKIKANEIQQTYGTAIFVSKLLQSISLQVNSKCGSDIADFLL